MTARSATKIASAAKTPPPDQAWLSELTTTITKVARITHSTRLYEAMGESADLDIRPYLFGVLARIGDLQPVRVSEVAAHMDYDRSTVSRHVAELTALGCVERKTDADDGRAVILRLSSKGERAVKKVFEAWMEFLHGSTLDWTTADRQQFLDLLRRFGTSVEARVAEL